MSFSSSGMSGGRAEEIFQSFFANGDPFAGFGFGDDDFFKSSRFASQRTRGSGGGGGRRARVASARADVLPPQAVVKLAGLQNDTLNGSVGLVEGYEESSGRYNVRLSGRNEVVAIKTRNVRQVISEARIEGTSQEALNGRIAASAVFDSDS